MTTETATTGTISEFKYKVEEPTAGHTIVSIIPIDMPFDDAICQIVFPGPEYSEDGTLSTPDPYIRPGAMYKQLDFSLAREIVFAYSTAAEILRCGKTSADLEVFKCNLKIRRDNRLYGLIPPVKS
jgi:hypothetical protein